MNSRMLRNYRPRFFPSFGLDPVERGRLQPIPSSLEREEPCFESRQFHGALPQSRLYRRPLSFSPQNLTLRFQIYMAALATTISDHPHKLVECCKSRIHEILLR